MIFDIEPINKKSQFNYEKYLVNELGWKKLPNRTFRITYPTVHHNGSSPSERDVCVDFCNLTEKDKTVVTFKVIFKVNENGELI